MDGFREHLGMVRMSVDQLIDETGLGSKKVTLDELLMKTGFEGAAICQAKAFAEDYFTIADEHQQKIKELEEKKEGMSKRSGTSIGRLVYHTIVSGIGLGLITSSIGYGAIGATAGLLAEVANQRWWHRAASPAAAGWWGLAGGVIGAAADYWMRSGMPFFTYILATTAGVSSVLRQAEKVIDRDTPETINNKINKLQDEHCMRGDAMVQRYAMMMRE